MHSNYNLIVYDHVKTACMIYMKTNIKCIETNVLNKFDRLHNNNRTITTYFNNKHYDDNDDSALNDDSDDGNI